MTTRQTGLSVPGPAAAGHAGVQVVGAGISGVGTGYRLKTRLAGTTFLILDAHEDRRHLGSVPVPGVYFDSAGCLHMSTSPCR
jgi:hypothetical protein